MELIKAKGKGKRAESKDKKTLFPIPYSLFLEHGGNIYRLAEELGIPEDNLIDFSASINPLGVSRKVKNAIKNEMNSLINYPDPETKMLREELSQFHDIGPETIVCGNGSTELIYLIPRALKPKKVLIPAPTFSEYERACKASGKLQVASYKLKKENKFMLIPDEFISAIKENVNSNQNPSPVTCHLSLVTCHLSPVTRHISL